MSFSFSDAIRAANQDMRGDTEPVDVPRVTLRTKSKFSFVRTANLGERQQKSHADMLEAFQREKKETGLISYVPYIDRDITRHRENFNGFVKFLEHRIEENYFYRALLYQDVVVGEARLYLPEVRSQALKISDGGHIQYYVHPEHRRKGIASILLQKSCAFLGQEGIQQAQAVVAKENEASAGLLEKVEGAGFAQEKRGRDGKRHFFISTGLPNKIFWPKGRTRKCGPDEPKI